MKDRYVFIILNGVELVYTVFIQTPVCPILIVYTGMLIANIICNAILYYVKIGQAFFAALNSGRQILHWYFCKYLPNSIKYTH